jgi:hypothetical protein
MKVVRKMGNWKLLGLTVGLMACMVGLGVQRAEADSYTFAAVGDTYTANFSHTFTCDAECASGGGTLGQEYTLSGSVTYTVDAISDTGITLTTVVSNTSTTGTNEGIVTFGFDHSDPTLASASLTQLSPSGDTDVFSKVFTDVNAPEFGTVQLCTTTAVNCASGNPPRLLEGQTDTFQLVLAYSTTSSTFTIDTSFIRFTGDLGSYTFGSNGTLPAPSSLTLIGAGMLAWGMARRWLHA